MTARRPFPIGTAFELLTTLGFFSRPFDRRKPVRAMNGSCSRSLALCLESVPQAKRLFTGVELELDVGRVADQHELEVPAVERGPGGSIPPAQDRPPQP